MPKTNSLNDALRASAKAEPGPAGRRERPAARNCPSKLVGAHFPEPVHRQLRVLSAQEGRTLQAVLAEALNDLFAKRKLPPIAWTDLREVESSSGASSSCAGPRAANSSRCCCPRKS